MSFRQLRLFAVPLIAIVTLALAATSATAQSAPKTGWGDPDLQGIWTSSGATPFERPTAQAGRETLTDEEVASIRASTAARDEELANRAAQRTEAGGNVGAYNNFWMDRGQRTNRTSMVVDPPDGRLPPKTAAGEYASKTRLKSPGGAERGDTWEDRHIWERCVTRGGMPNAMFPRSYNNNMQVFQTPDHVVMLIEQVHEVRVVALDGRDHPSDKIGQWNGISTGHFEGDTLVVVTSNLESRVSALQPWSLFDSSEGSGENITLIERFTRTGPDSLEYEVEVFDPQMYTQSWTVAYPFWSLNDLMYEYACHEGNEGMIGMLAGRRAEDDAAK
ncbi:MAG: hypothetical protein QGI10_14950 [Vicinamibacterales bacterium]|jgi:hypothetical protein|nr:hypothetical protein [Vicinamibacterales bacterium]|tara:strand:+ start:749 stop:1744 length:996 start_codon:yes stop_codon:yes gene_type:complete